jgi:hypothetical protein
MRKLKAIIALLGLAAIAFAAIAAFEFYWLTPTEIFATPRSVTIEKGE